jgi:hypothetical protein
MSIRFALGLCAFVSALACNAGRPGLDAIAEGYVRAALKLSQHDPALVEQWRGPEAWTPGPRRPVAELQQEIAALDRQIQAATADYLSAAEQARASYLSGQIRALQYAVERQLGRAATIDDQARDEFGVTFPPLDRGAVARAHQQLSEALPGDQPLATRLMVLRRATTIPRERRLPVLTKALEACRAALPPAVSLPETEQINLVFKAGMSWDGFARYQGRHRTDIEIDDAGYLDVSRAVRLACHEGYPGHHVQHLLIDRAFEEHQWPELLLTPGFGPHLLLGEGAAEVAADLALPVRQRTELYRTLFPIAELDVAKIPQLVRAEEVLPDLLPVVTDVARQYLASQITQQQAMERLAGEALVANPRGLLAFIEQRRARALVYGEGRRIVYAAMQTRDLPALFEAFQRAAAVKWTP